jgi:protein O-mannosyl-transferase
MITAGNELAEVDKPQGTHGPASTLICLLILFLVAVLPYTNTLLGGFVYDDSTQVLDNPYVRSFRYLPQIFTKSVWSFKGYASNYYRPIMTLGYLLLYKAFGLAPYGFHLANVLLHTAVVLVLFFLTLRMFRRATLAFAAAAVFALHPIHTEAVAWIAAITELELAFFFILTFWLFLEVARSGGKRSELMHVAMAASFGIALLAKEQALTLPFLATVYEHFYRADRGETTRAQKFSRYGVFWLLAIAYILLRIRFLGDFAPHVFSRNLTAYPTILSAIALVGQYLWKLVWPVHLCAFYVFNPSVSLLDPRVLFGIGGLMLCATLFAILWKQARTASFGVFWLLATLAPVLNHHWMGLNVFTERYLYLPSVGFCWLIACGFERLWVIACSRAVWHRALATALAIPLILGAWRIVTRNRDWQDNFVFYTRTLEASPNAHSLRNNLGGVYRKQGDWEAAEREWRRVQALDTNDIECLNNLAGLSIEQGQYAEARELLQRAIQLNPGLATSHLNLGLVYMQTDRLDQAELQLRAAVALTPSNGLGYANLGALYWRKGDLSHADGAFKRALSFSPYDSRVRCKLAEFYAAEGRNAEAIEEYQAVLADDPGNAEALTALLKLESGNPHTASSAP